MNEGSEGSSGEDSSRRHRRILRFTIRELFLLTVVVALAASLFYQSARRAIVPTYALPIDDTQLIGWARQEDASVSWLDASRESYSNVDIREFTIQYNPVKRDRIVRRIVAMFDATLAGEEWDIRSNRRGSARSVSLQKGPRRLRLHMYFNELASDSNLPNQGTLQILIVLIDESNLPE